MLGHKHAEIAKRIDIAATAIFNNMRVEEMSDLDLSYTPPLGSPWEAVQMGTPAWGHGFRHLSTLGECLYGQPHHHPGRANVPAQRSPRSAHRVPRHLRRGSQQLESLLLDSYNELESKATVARWLVVGAERFARQRFAHAQLTANGKSPAILFICAQCRAVADGSRLVQAARGGPGNRLVGRLRTSLRNRSLRACSRR